MRHKSIDNMKQSNDTDSNIATIIMLIIILSGLAIGVYYLQKYSLINLTPTSTSEKNKEKDKTNNNRPGQNSLIIPEPLSDKINQRSMRFTIKEVKADSKGYLFTGEVFCTHPKYNWGKLYVDGVLIDGYYTKTKFEVQDDYDFDLPEESQNTTEVEFRITKTELDNYNIRGFSKLTLFYFIETSDGTIDETIKSETFFFTSNFTTDNTRKGLIHIDEKGSTKVRYYKTVRDSDYTYIYFDFQNSDYSNNKEILIKNMYINDKPYDLSSFKEVIYRGSQRDVYIKIPRKKINNVKNIRVSFFIIERTPDNNIKKAYITNEYSKNV